MGGRQPLAHLLASVGGGGRDQEWMADLSCTV